MKYIELARPKCVRMCVNMIQGSYKYSISLDMLHNYKRSSTIQYNSDVSLFSVVSVRIHVAVFTLEDEFYGHFTMKYKSQGCIFNISLFPHTVVVYEHFIKFSFATFASFFHFYFFLASLFPPTAQVS
jgi:hypothetical protein